MRAILFVHEAAHFDGNYGRPYVDAKVYGGRRNANKDVTYLPVSSDLYVACILKYIFYLVKIFKCALFMYNHGFWSNFRWVNETPPPFQSDM